MSKLKSIFLISFSLVVSQLVFAKEGMWLPFLLQQLNEGEMQSMGMKLSADDIYSVNHSSLKDAVLIFGGGCTGEVISDQGLVLTNHHCGYGQIQSHSSLDHDYLTNGFWAMSQNEELPNPGLKVTFVIRMEDVTKQVTEGIPSDIGEKERAEYIANKSKLITEEAVAETHYDAEVRPFYHGNQFILIVTETYKDIRMVGAPPSSIGKFGFDTDNWVWPRHTGDFSMFRIYAGKDNKPADYSPENVPFTPRHHFPVSLKGYQEDDFTMVFGFPGRTEEYLPSVAVEYVLNESNPAKIAMRDQSLAIINKWMKSDPLINIQYASKQSRISNAWKKWIGQSKGLKENDALEVKRALEADFQNKVDNNADWKQKYGSILADYKSVYDEAAAYMLSREMFIEYYYYGPEIFRFASKFDVLMDKDQSDEDLTRNIENLRKATEAHFKNYQEAVDRELFEQLSTLYLGQLDQIMHPRELTLFLTRKDPVRALYDKTLFASKEAVLDFLDDFKRKDVKDIEKDWAYIIQKDITNNYNEIVRPRLSEYGNQLDLLNRTYMQALMEVMPDYKNYYPDANFSLRVTYGKVKSYQPKNAVTYLPYTTTSGIIEKMDTTSYEYDVPEKLVDLIETNDYGVYADADGTMHVCFIATNHTTGGNSGSPAINANGELIGLNFDRTWESTMSDIMYDPNICRNIMVDIRYVLFIIDKYAGAKHLVDEMTLISEQQ
tara:strand:+ start:371 stop:2527 length:2157 start_codon:yes stop_codon:yes gene_type:complete